MAQQFGGLLERETVAERAAAGRRGYDVLLRCFADAVGADSVALLARAIRDGDPEARFTLRELLARSGDHLGERVIATWSRTGEPVSISWWSGGLVERGIGGDRAIIESGGPRPFRIGYGSAGSSPAALAAPVRSPGGPIGVLYASLPAPPDAAAADSLRHTAQAFAATAGLCLTDMGGIATTLRASGLDSLTGCLSAERGRDVLGAEIARSRRYGERLSLCFADLDALKPINDRHGHLAGNRVLSGAAAALRSQTRRYDSVARFGGDEFMVVLPQTGMRGALEVARRMLLAVESVGAPGEDPITVSIGVAEWTEGMSSDAIVDLADRAVRDAKDRGGGRVVAAPGGSRPRRRFLRRRFARGSGANGSGANGSGANGSGANGSGRYREVTRTE